MPRCSFSLGNGRYVEGEILDSLERYVKILGSIRGISGPSIDREGMYIATSLRVHHVWTLEILEAT